MKFVQIRRQRSIPITTCFPVADGFRNPTRENRSHSVLEKGLA